MSGDYRPLQHQDVRASMSSFISVYYVREMKPNLAILYLLACMVFLCQASYKIVGSETRPSIHSALKGNSTKKTNKPHVYVTVCMSVYIHTFVCLFVLSLLFFDVCDIARATA